MLNFRFIVRGDYAGLNRQLFRFLALNASPFAGSVLNPIFLCIRGSRGSQQAKL